MPEHSFSTIAKLILKSTFVLASILASGAISAQHLGIGSNKKSTAAVLEISSVDKGFLPPRMTSDQRDAIAAPTIGLVIFNTTTNCINIYGENNSWQEVCGTALTPSISNMNCTNITHNGLLIMDNAANGVSSNISYTGGNGEVYSSQSIPSSGLTGLTATLATGALANGAGTLTFSISGTPQAGSGDTAFFAINFGGRTCTIKRYVLRPSISSLSCNTASDKGSLISGIAASGVSSKISYAGGNGAAYISQSISSTGVTGLTATLIAGTLANGTDSLTYTISGTPGGWGEASFAINLGGQTCTLIRNVEGYFHCNPSKRTAVIDVTNPNTGKIWMDRNLGAHRKATSSADAQSYGSFFQWGRAADGHQCTHRYSGDGVSTSSIYHASFATTSAPNSGNAWDGHFIGGGNDWLSTSDDVLWQGVNGTNNPCPAEYRVPTLVELEAERQSWNFNTTPTAIDAFNTSLAWTVAGLRRADINQIIFAGSDGNYWSSTVVPSGSNASYLYFGSTNSGTTDYLRVYGAAIRCIKDLPDAALASLNCTGITNKGSLTSGVIANGVSSDIPYTGGNGGTYSGQSISSTGATGLTATLIAGKLSNEVSVLSFAISGAPNPGTGDTAFFAINIGGQSCTLKRYIMGPSVSAINCNETTNTGSLTYNTTASGVSSKVPYTGGNGAGYGSQSIPSTDVSGLTATLTTGTLTNAADSLTYIISGTPQPGTGNDTAYFSINFGGRSCSLKRYVTGGPAVTAINCNAANHNGSLAYNAIASGVSSKIPYTGGNGVAHGSQSIPSTGVTGLTATLATATLANGADSLTYTISGTPGQGDTAFFAITFGGQKCTLKRFVTGPAIASINCNAANNKGSLVFRNAVANGVTSKIPYTGGNGGTYPSQSISSTGVIGLTATLAAGTLTTGSDSLTYTISGTPIGGTGSTAYFAIDVGGQGCTLARNVTGASIASLNCNRARNIGSLTSDIVTNGVSFRVPYTGGNGGTYPGQSIASTGVTGLTATLAAGTLVNGTDSLTYIISGIPNNGGIAYFNINIGGQSCTMTTSVAGYKHCNPSKRTLVVDVTNATTGKTWMDRNLGAHRKAQSQFDDQSRGSLFQWGRAADGHQCIHRYTGDGVTSSSISTTKATTATPNTGLSSDGLFILAGGNDWLQTPSNAMWQGVNSINNPCPSGYRLPTETELDAESASWASQNATGAFASPLRWPSTGYRNTTFGAPVISTDAVWLWSGTPSGSHSKSKMLAAVSIAAFLPDVERNIGAAVRCIKDAANPLVTGLSCNGTRNKGSIISGVPANNVYSKIPYAGGNGGTYPGQSIPSTGVSGLTATRVPGNLVNGADSVTYAISGTPLIASEDTAFFTINIGGQSCTLKRFVAGPAIATINCNTANNKGSLTTGSPAIGVSSRIPYSGGNGIAFGYQSIPSSGVTGLTAILAAETLTNGADSLTYTISGTPDPGKGDTAIFTINIGGRSCTLKRYVLGPTIASIDCKTANNKGSLTSGIQASGVSSNIPYTGGNGAGLSSQSIASTGVLGLTATLQAGPLANGKDSLSYTISGTPQPGTGDTAFFAINIGGQACTLKRYVVGPTIASMNCIAVNNKGSLSYNLAATGVSSRVPYIGGNGAGYSGQSISSTRVTGLTATLVAGTLANGADSLTYTISGTPGQGDTAFFAINIGGQSCTLKRFVTGGPAIASINCNAANNKGSLVFHNAAANGVSSKIPYTGGNGGNYEAQSIPSTGVTGLTATLVAGTLASGTDSLTYTISGTPQPGAGSTAFFAINIGGQACTLARNVSGPSFTSLNCNAVVNTGYLTSDVAATGASFKIPYTGGNGGAYSSQSISSTGVSGLTATLAAGTIANGADSLTYTISGTPNNGGLAYFAINIGGQSCTLVRSVGGYRHCNLSQRTALVDVTNAATGKIWMDRNLGAHQKATSSADAMAYGSLFQWGRAADGHQCLHRYANDGVTTSSIFNTNPATTSAPNAGNAWDSLFVISASGIDWLSSSNDNLWQGVNGTNNPCPTGYRVPTLVELDVERLSWSSNDAAGAFNASLAWTNAGLRRADNNQIHFVGSSGNYWSSTVVPSGANTNYLVIGPNTSSTNNFQRSHGISVRCIKDLPDAALTSLNCPGITGQGSLITGIAATGVSSAIPYTSGNGGTYPSQSISSTGVTGLTATLSPGILANGAGNLIYSISGTPNPGTGDTAFFAISISGQACTLKRFVTGPLISTIDCKGTAHSGSLTSGVAAGNGASSKIPYSGGNGAAYIIQSISSTGVTGLTATLAAGKLANGTDSLTYTISGTPNPGNGNDTAFFAINFGGRACTLKRYIIGPAIASLNCNTANNKGSLTSGIPASGVTSRIHYTGGNGVAYGSQSVPSTRVIGLTATLTAGNLANGPDSLTYTINGTPQPGSGNDTAIFAINIGGQACTLKRYVAGPTLTLLNCNTASNRGSLVYQTVASGVTSRIHYTGGNGVAYGSQSIPSTGVTGLTANLTTGTLANGADSLTYTISGTPGQGDTAFFAINIAGQSCTLERPVTGGPVIASVNCNGANNKGSLVFYSAVANGVSSKVPYAGGNGRTYPGQSIPSTGVIGLTATLAAGTLANGADSLTYTISGTPQLGTGATAFFAINTGGRSCVLARNVTGATIASINCNGARNMGSLTSDIAASGVSSKIPYTGGNGGTYSSQSIPSTGVSGLTATLVAGTIANGADSLTYTISGTPNNGGLAHFNINIGGQSCTLVRSVIGYRHCNPSQRTAVVDVTNATTGKIWMDRNLGAHQKASSSADVKAYGSLFQWGRAADGHQCVQRYINDGVTTSSPFSTNPATTSNPNEGNAWDNHFVITANRIDWLSPSNDNLWQGVNGNNNPCPSGYRVPTLVELDAERQSWTSNDAAGAINSSLAWSNPGLRRGDHNQILYVGSSGNYWSSTVVPSSVDASYLFFGPNSSGTTSFQRSHGISVRCIKN